MFTRGTRLYNPPKRFEQLGDHLFPESWVKQLLHFGDATNIVIRNPEEEAGDRIPELERGEEVKTWADVDAALEEHNTTACETYDGPTPLEPLLNDLFWRRSSRPVQKWMWLEVRRGLVERGRGLFAKCDIPAHVIVCDYYGFISTETDHDRRLEGVTNEEEANNVKNYRLYIEGKTDRSSTD